jgi:hypothetical protein
MVRDRSTCMYMYIPGQGSAKSKTVSAYRRVSQPSFLPSRFQVYWWLCFSFPFSHVTVPCAQRTPHAPVQAQPPHNAPPLPYSPAAVPLPVPRKGHAPSWTAAQSGPSQAS